MKSVPIMIKHLPRRPYHPVWQSMQKFTQERADNDDDQLWLLEHDPVFTQGLAGKAEHILQQTSIPIVQTDRGGQVTYHGPGQLMAYPLLNIARLKLGPRELVVKLEQVIIRLLAQYGIAASGCRTAPGVYVDEAKIASIGLRIRRGCCYHGIALNVDMNLSPFQSINPCGHANMKMTQIKEFVPQIDITQVKSQFVDTFCDVFGYTSADQKQETGNEHDKPSL